MSVTHPSPQARGRAVADAAPTGDPTWTRVLLVAGSRAVLAVVLSLAVWSVLPAALGWSPRVVASGSMMPRLQVGDVVVDRPVDPGDLTEGRIITVTDPDHPGRTRTHRFLRRDADGDLVTRGDANEAADSTTVDPDDVLGVAALRVPYIGLPASWATQGRVVPLGLAFSALLLLGVAASRPLRLADGLGDGDGPGEGGDGPGEGGDGPGDRDDPDDRDDLDDDLDGRGAGLGILAPRPVVGQRRAGVGGGALAAVAALLATVMTTQPTHAAYSSVTHNPVSSFAAAASFTPYRDEVLRDGPTLYWRLGETGGTVAADSSGAGATGVARGAVTWGLAGALVSEPVATAAAFAGGSVSSESARDGSTRFSFETWVRTTTTLGGSLLSLGDTGGDVPSTTIDRVLYMEPGGRVRFGVLGTGGTLGLQSATTAARSTGSLNDGSWHHVVGTYEPVVGGLKLYVDGTLQDSQTATYTVRSRTGWFYRAASDITATWPDGPLALTFTGQLDEVAVYDGRVLSAAEVAAHRAVAVAR